MNSILNPPRNYVEYRCFTHGLSDTDLIKAQEKFYKNRSEQRREIIEFFNWIVKQRNAFSLPWEKVELLDGEGKKTGAVCQMMIYDIEYWMEDGRIRQKKIYMAEPGQLQAALDMPVKVIDYKQHAYEPDEREPGQEG